MAFEEAMTLNTKCSIFSKRNKKGILKGISSVILMSSYGLIFNIIRMDKLRE